MMLLASHPEVQEWLHEEIVRVVESTPIDDWDYDSFARLKRCQAIFLETLRLYGPNTGLPKMTSENTQTLQVGGQVLNLLPRTETYLYLLGVHTDARYWDDTLVWKPSRWIVGRASTTQGSEEEILTLRRDPPVHGQAGRRVVLENYLPGRGSCRTSLLVQNSLDPPKDREE